MSHGADENSVGLKDVLKRAGAKIITDKEEECDIDLSPETIEKDTFINLLTEKA